jgi:hypothetical protein
MAERVLSVDHLPLASLHLDPQNPLLHNKKQVQQIARSIETFGVNIPLLIHGKQILPRRRPAVRLKQRLDMRPGRPSQQCGVAQGS